MITFNTFTHICKHALNTKSRNFGNHMLMSKSYATLESMVTIIYGLLFTAHHGKENEESKEPVQGNPGFYY